MHFSAGAPTTDMEPVNTLLSADTMRIITHQQDIENTRRHTQNTNTRYQYLMIMRTKYYITKVFVQILLSQESRRMKTV